MWVKASKSLLLFWQQQCSLTLCVATSPSLMSNWFPREGKTEIRKREKPDQTCYGSLLCGWEGGKGPVCIFEISSDASLGLPPSLLFTARLGDQLQMQNVIVKWHPDCFFAQNGLYAQLYREPERTPAIVWKKVRKTSHFNQTKRLLPNYDRSLLLFSRPMR